jgi:hypothetical protein
LSLCLFVLSVGEGKRQQGEEQDELRGRVARYPDVAELDLRPLAI